MASTLVLVGVAHSIGELIGEHASIVRNITQIEVPRMQLAELREIVEKGAERAGLAFKPEAVEKVAALSEGLPHYTHLLALHAGQRVVENDRTEVSPADVNAAIPEAIKRHTVQRLPESDP